MSKIDHDTGKWVLWVLCLLLAAPGASTSATSAPKVRIDVEEANPWSHLDFPERPHDFHFAIVSDNTWGPRPGVFAGAIQSLRRMRPDFVLSVGDFVQGLPSRNTPEDMARLEDDWEEIQHAIDTLDVPFFWVPGNHDVSSKEARDLWTERFGRTWASFVYEDCLFLLLDSDDPPGTRLGKIGAKQVQWLEHELRRYSGVRWTFVFLHRPLWIDDVSQWIPVERLLAGRPRTVFSGHHHTFSHVTVQGYDYFTLATTGALSRLLGPEDGTFDHVTWVSIPAGGPPRVSQILLDALRGPDPTADVPPAPPTTSAPSSPPE